MFRMVAPPEGFDGFINADTGWRLAEKLIVERGNVGGLVEPLPAMFFDTIIKHYGGISTRGDRPEIQPRWAEIRRRLSAMKQSALDAIGR
jgi:hypothetical protein